MKRKLMRAGGLWLIALMIMVGRVPARADDNADQNLYVDYLAGSWDNWSTGFNSTPVWNATEHVHSYAYSARLTFTKAFGGVRFHFRGFDTRAFDTNGFSDLVFSVHWGDQAPQAVLVYALRNADFNKITAKLKITDYMTPDDQAAEPGWFTIDVPLAHLGVANVTDLTDIVLSGPNAKAPFWVDDMRLVKPKGPSRVGISVDATKPLRALDGRHLGVNAAAWDSTLATPATIQRVQAAGAQFFRFPGGSTADHYHWQQNKIDTATASSNTDQFMKLVQAAGGQAIITVNYGSGTPAEAAAWVKFANVDHTYSVKYWEIGNENYDTTEAGSHDPAVYAQKFGDFFTAMKAVDPTIKIGMAGTYSANSAENNGNEHNGWGPKVLKALKVVPDFYVVHYYPEERWSNTPHEDDADLLQYPKDWATIVPIVRGMLNNTLGTNAANVEIMATENNSTAQPGKQSVSVVNALYLADSLGQALNTELTGFMWWDLHNAADPKQNNSLTLYGLRDYGDFGLLSTPSSPDLAPNSPYPTYYALQLFSRVAGAGSHLVAAASNEELLPSYASVRPDGSVALVVINKNSEKQIQATVNLKGLQPTKMQVAQYGVFEDAVGVGPTTYELSLNSPSFLFVFPSYSITVLTLQP